MLVVEAGEFHMRNDAQSPFTSVRRRGLQRAGAYKEPRPFAVVEEFLAEFAGEPKWRRPILLIVGGKVLDARADAEGLHPIDVGGGESGLATSSPKVPGP